MPSAAPFRPLDALETGPTGCPFDEGSLLDAAQRHLAPLRFAAEGLRDTLKDVSAQRGA